MDEDRGTKRAADSVELPPLQSSGGEPSSGGGSLNPAAVVFVPRQQTAHEECEQRAVADETKAERRVRRREAELQMTLRRARQAERKAAADAEAAAVAKHNATELLKVQTRLARPLGVPRRQPPSG